MLTESMVPSALGHWRDYAELCKPRVVGLIVFTAVIGMFLATPGAVPLAILIPATLGIGLAAGSAAAINHGFQRHDHEFHEPSGPPWIHSNSAAGDVWLAPSGSTSQPRTVEPSAAAADTSVNEPGSAGAGAGPSRIVGC